MPTNSAELAQWLEAIATTLAVVVALVIALFQDKMRAWIMRPMLEVEIEAKPPECVKIPMTTPVGVQPALASDAYFLRLRISNKGNQAAESVEVFAASLLRRQADGTFRDVSTFLPMNLRWAHYGTVFVHAISPGIHRHCDLAHVLDPKKRGQFVGEDRKWPNIPPERTVLSLDTIVKPNTLDHLLPPGQYRLAILVAASNAKLVRRTIELSLTGDWYDDEQKMLQDGIGVRMLT